MYLNIVVSANNELEFGFAVEIYEMGRRREDVALGKCYLSKHTEECLAELILMYNKGEKLLNRAPAITNVLYLKICRDPHVIIV